MKNEFVLKELEDTPRHSLGDEDEIEFLKFAIEQSNSAIAGQVSTLNSLRQRAVNIIAINGAILLLARTIIDDTSITSRNLQQNFFEWVIFDGIQILAVIIFLISVCCSLFVLKTRSGWRFSVSGNRLVLKYIESKKYNNISDIYKDYISISEKNYFHNDRQLSTIHMLLFLAICGTLLHGFLWLLEGYHG